MSIGDTNKNRNFLRSGVQSVTTGRFGFELNNNRDDNNENFFQTLIGGFTQSFSIPRLLWPLGFLDKRNLDARRTAINMSFTYTDRFAFFQQTSVGTNLQWEWRKGRNTYNFVFPNFESVDLVPTDSLINEIIKNPSLALSFTPGNILSVRGSFEHAIQYKKSKYSGFYRVGSEFALPVPGELFGREFFKFLRFDGQFIHRKAVGVNSWNYRLYSGVGFRVFSDYNKASLPYFRQFVAGGNNSMRAWPLRLLGVGYSISNDTATYKDRFGDIQLELNAEYRFRITRLFGFNLDGAAFTDIGNIWNRVNNPDGEGKFNISKLYRDLGVCVGTGIRWDFTYLIIRLDLGFKLKDPVRAGNGWLTQLELKSPNRIEGYPENQNYALQFGIGYPF
jgi:outer membrane protein assembly factor BamA